MMRRSNLVWSQIHPEAPVSPSAAEAAFVSLAGVPGSPHTVLEVGGSGGVVAWRVGSPAGAHQRILKALAVFLGELRPDTAGVTGSPFSTVSSTRGDSLLSQVCNPGDLVEADATGVTASRAVTSGETLSAAIRVGGQPPRPLAPDALERATRGLLSVLASTKRGERLRVQIVLGPRLRPRTLGETSHASARQRRPTLDKLAEHRFQCEIRMHARAELRERAHALVTSAIGALRVMESPDARLKGVRVSDAVFERASMPLLWHTTLSTSELPAFTGWPISTLRPSDLVTFENPDGTSAVLPGVPSLHPKVLAPSPRIPIHGRVLGTALDAARPASAVNRRAEQRSIALSESDSLRHLHILGPNGVGKSTLMANLALHDITAGHSVIVIDPKGDLITDILARIPENRVSDVVVLDPADTAPVGIDCFAGDPELTADALLGIFHSLYESSWGPRTSDILHASLLALSRYAALEQPELPTKARDGSNRSAGVSLLMVPLLLTNPGFRRSVTGRVNKHDPLGLGIFWATFEQWSDAERSHAIQPLMNKLRQVLLRPGLRGVFGQRHPKFAMRDLFAPGTRRRILLVSLSEGSLGPEASTLLGSLTVGLLWQAALARTNVPDTARHPVFLHIDEMQRYTHIGDIGDALARARGLGLSMTLAHQSISQLTTSTAEALKANARSKIAFTLGSTDAHIYARMSNGRLAPADFQALPAYTAYASLVAGNTQMPWCSLATAPMPPVMPPPVPVPASASRLTSNGQTGRAWADMVRDVSRRNYGQPLDQVENELLELTGLTGSHPDADDPGSDERTRSTGISRSGRVGRSRPTRSYGTPNAGGGQQ